MKKKWGGEIRVGGTKGGRGALHEEGWMDTAREVKKQQDIAGQAGEIGEAGRMRGVKTAGNVSRRLRKEAA